MKLSALNKISNKIVVALLTILGSAFYTVTEMELSPAALVSLLIAGTALASSYSIEDFVALLAGEIKPTAETIFYSKRFWLTVAFAVNTFAMETYPIDMRFDLFGYEASIYFVLTVVFASLLTGLTAEDIALAQGQPEQGVG